MCNFVSCEEEEMVPGSGWDVGITPYTYHNVGKIELKDYFNVKNIEICAFSPFICFP